MIVGKIVIVVPFLRLFSLFEFSLRSSNVEVSVASHVQ